MFTNEKPFANTIFDHVQYLFIIMVELENVLANYLVTKTQTKRVPGQNTTIALQALRDELPTILLKFVERAGYDPKNFSATGSAGQPNRSFPKVPWVSVFYRPICTSATKGYYIVFLFAEDMSSVTMSLNQGYTAFEKRYVSPELAYPKLQDCAQAVLKYLTPLPTGFDVGPVDLHTDGPLGKGYEAASILSKTYLAGTTPSASEVESDFAHLLAAFMILAARFPTSLIDLDVAVSDGQILEAAKRVDLKHRGVPKTSGPQPPPLLGMIGQKAKYVRSIEVVASALAIAKASCSLGNTNVPHITFPSAKTKENYVEAHHFVPFSQQCNFPVSLDVEENIAVLCPNCHRLLHHGTSVSKTAHLKTLFRNREASLKTRGIDISLDQLLKMYKALDAND